MIRNGNRQSSMSSPVPPCLPREPSLHIGTLSDGDSGHFACALSQPASPGSVDALRITEPPSLTTGADDARRHLGNVALAVVARRAGCGRGFVPHDDRQAQPRLTNPQAAARDFVSKKRAWLTMAFTISGTNGLVMRKAGSGFSPVSKRSGKAVMKITGIS